MGLIGLPSFLRDIPHATFDPILYIMFFLLIIFIDTLLSLLFCELNPDIIRKVSKHVHVQYIYECTCNGHICNDFLSTRILFVLNVQKSYSAVKRDLNSY